MIEVDFSWKEFKWEFIDKICPSSNMPHVWFYSIKVKKKILFRYFLGRCTQATRRFRTSLFATCVKSSTRTTRARSTVTWTHGGTTAPNARRQKTTVSSSTRKKSTNCTAFKFPGPWMIDVRSLTVINAKANKMWNQLLKLRKREKYRLLN